MKQIKFQGFLTKTKDHSRQLKWMNITIASCTMNQTDGQDCLDEKKLENCKEINNGIS